MIALEARPEPSRLMAWTSPLLAAAATFVAGFILFSLLGKNPFDAFFLFFIEPVATRYGVGELLLKASPLMLCAVGLAIGYRANVWNIGAEGQLTIGAICGGGVALWLPQLDSAVLLPLMIIAGAAGGIAWAAIPAWLRTRCNANEILTSLMLVYIATLTLSYLVQGPWRDPEGFNFPQSRLFADDALLPLLLSGTRLNVGFLLAMAAIAASWVFTDRTLGGFRMRVAGLAPRAARYAGISATRTVWIGMLVGGAAAGIAGVGEAAGPVGQLLPSMSPGYGFAAIIVAFVGRLHALGIVFASLLMSLLYLGGEA
ncbi:MAG: ABC transporter permease, partial [Betaproteobacteria bacterium]